MKILVIGSDGMLGHVVTLHFKEKGYKVITTSRKSNSDYQYDIESDINKIEKIIEKEKPNVVINCTGILNKIAEEHQAKAVIINSYFPHYLDEISAKYNFKFLHVSTDCVFEGLDGKYDENSFRDAKSFYGRSKALGEIDNDRSITLRTSIIGPDINTTGIGLFQWFMNSIGSIDGYKNVLWTGITTIEFAKQMEKAINHNLSGLYDVVNGEEISKYDLLTLIAEIFDKNITIFPNYDLISKKTLIKSQKFDFDVPTYKKMIKEMKEWIVNHQELYPNLNNMEAKKR